MFSSIRFNGSMSYESREFDGWAGDYVCDGCKQPRIGVYRSDVAGWLCESCREFRAAEPATGGVKTPAMVDFAARHRLKTRIDADGTTIIPGRDGSSHIYENGDDLLGVLYMPRVAGKPVTGAIMKWNRRRDKSEAAGMELQQNGDYEGSLTFDPENAQQVKLAIWIAGVKPKRIMSEAQREAARRGLVVANSRVAGP
jgi:ribosomal protein L37AE/L43A